jgi:hypothetical protein
MIRAQVLAHYSDGNPQCARCGSTDDLEIDHIKSRAEQGRPNDADVGAKLYRRLKREGFPPGYQVLCRSCNSSKGGYGFGRRPTQILVQVVKKGNRVNYISKPGFTGTPEWEESERFRASQHPDAYTAAVRARTLWRQTYEQLRREVLHRFRAASGTRPTVKAWEQAARRAAETLRDQLSTERRSRRETLEMTLYFSDRMLLLRLALDDDGWLKRIAAELPRTTTPERKDGR